MIEFSFAHWLVIISVCISVFGGVVYVRDTIRGSTKPNRVSWSMWALAPLIGAGAALNAHADAWATSRILLAGLIPLIVFIASFVNRRSYWKLTFFDFLCGVCSLMAIISWFSAHSPTIAVLLSALGDGFASLPTIHKAWLHPETETGTTFLAGLIATVLVLPSIPIWNIQNSAFQIYLMVVNVVLLFAIYRRRIFSHS
jgi:hypothetical protein